MKKTMLSTILGLSLLAPVTHANEFAGMEGFENDEAVSIQELKGLGIGAIVGGLIAGPGGAFLGGASGGLIAHADTSTDETASLREELQTVHSELASLKQKHKKLVAVHGKTLLQKTRIVDNHSGSSIKSTIASKLGMTVQFRHDSAVLEEHFVKQLEQLARSFSGAADLHIHLSGHTDRTGGDNYNEKLSRSRVESVAGVLSKAGWPASKLHLRAYGEQEPLTVDSDIKGYGFDRRVMITFSTGGTGA